MFRGHNKTFHAFFVAESNVVKSYFLIAIYCTIPISKTYFIGGKGTFYYILYCPLENNTTQVMFCSLNYILEMLKDSATFFKN